MCQTVQKMITPVEFTPGIIAWDGVPATAMGEYATFSMQLDEAPPAGCGKVNWYYQLENVDYPLYYRRAIEWWGSLPPRQWEFEKVDSNHGRATKLLGVLGFGGFLHF